MGIFHINSPFMRGINKLVMLIYIGILWFIFSIPVFTAGAAAAAMYEVLLKMIRDQEGYVTKTFFRAFRSNLRQGICIWLPLLAAEILFSVNLMYYGIFGGKQYIVQGVVFAVLLLLTLAMTAYIFPVMARFENTVKGHFHMAFMLLIRNPGWTVLLIILWLATIFLIWFLVYFPILFIVGMSGYVQAVIADHIFNRMLENGSIIEEKANE